MAHVGVEGEVHGCTVSEEQSGQSEPKLCRPEGGRAGAAPTNLQTTARGWRWDSYGSGAGKEAWNSQGAQGDSGLAAVLGEAQFSPQSRTLPEDRRVVGEGCGRSLRCKPLAGPGDQ